jgi:hypothetical protein
LRALNNVMERGRAARLDRRADCYNIPITPIWSARTVASDRRTGVSVQAAVLSLADAVADRIGVLRRKLRAEDMLRTARRGAGLDDFGDMSFVGPLQLLLDK